MSFWLFLRGSYPDVHVHICNCVIIIFIIIIVINALDYVTKFVWGISSLELIRVNLSITFQNHIFGQLERMLGKWFTPPPPLPPTAKKENVCMPMMVHSRRPGIGIKLLIKKTRTILHDVVNKHKLINFLQYKHIQCSYYVI